MVREYMKKKKKEEKEQTIEYTTNLQLLRILT
jgi:hypothetical protein